MASERDGIAGTALPLAGADAKSLPPTWKDFDPDGIMDERGPYPLERVRLSSADPERVVQLITHRACCGTEHDPANGKLHGHCIVCGVPWPCEYAGKPPASAPSEERVRLEARLAELILIPSAPEAWNMSTGLEDYLSRRRRELESQLEAAPGEANTPPAER